MCVYLLLLFLCTWLLGITLLHCRNNMNFLTVDYGFKELRFLYIYPLYAWKSGLVRKHKIECNLRVSQVSRIKTMGVHSKHWVWGSLDKCLTWKITQNPWPCLGCVYKHFFIWTERPISGVFIYTASVSLSLWPEPFCHFEFLEDCAQSFALLSLIDIVI